MKLSTLLLALLCLAGSLKADASSGLDYKCYQGTWDYLPNFSTLTPVKTGNAANVSISVRSRDEQYAIMWKGYINIPTAGTYTFETVSDDGSSLYLSDYSATTSPLINNDGLHGARSGAGAVYLSAGAYPITIAFFNNAGAPGTMEVYWSSNTGIARQQIPSSAFASATTSASGLNYSCYQGTWDYLPNFSTLTPVKTGSTANVDISVRSRDEQYAIMWKGYINIPTAGTYTFETVSDDGSSLYLSDYSATTSPLINNDGLHGARSGAGAVYLSAGAYPITIAFFNNAGAPGTMEVYWSSNTGIARQQIPSSAFASATTSASGLNYSCYQGTWDYLPNFSTLTPVKTGSTANVDISVRSRDEQYAIMWKGYINIPTAGTYTFETVSDDGSSLYLSDYSATTSPLINNDGLHGARPASGTVYLSAGAYPITIAFFNNAGVPGTMEVYWSSNTGIARQQIPSSAFASASANTTIGGLNYSCYQGTWYYLPNFSTLTPVKTGSTANVDISVRSRDEQYAIMWKGYINIPTAGTYTFETVSDDGSSLYLSDYSATTAPLINNDGLHGARPASGTVYLSAGTYPITIAFFNNAGAPGTMEVYWSSNTGIARQQIPSSAFTVNSVSGVKTVVSTKVSGAHNYYFSTASGDDSRSSTQAQNPATPWKTIAKLNTFSSNLVAGDSVLFNRGEIFTGTLSVSRSGNSGLPIVFSAYGTGGKPVISGLTTMSNWVSVGNGIWESNCASSAKLNMVTVNGAVQAMGRYPNITDANRGYLTIQSHNGLSQITGSKLNDSPNWTGAEVVIRKCQWVLDRCLITSHSGNTINYISPTDAEAIDNFGYFIQNSPKTLDQTGEWYYNPATAKLMMYFGSVNPSASIVKASVVDRLIDITDQSNITIDNLSLVGGDIEALRIQNSTNVTVQNISVNSSGVEGIKAANSSYLSIKNSVFNNSNNDGLRLEECPHTTVMNNAIKNSGIIPGMGLSNNQQHDGIFITGDFNTIQENTIDSSGYCGITFTGNSILVKNNVINYFCLTVHDGGGVYTWGGFDKTDRKVISNIILNGKGAHEGTSESIDLGVAGIYTDDRSANLELLDNSISNCSRSGIYLHNSHEITMKGNTLFNNVVQMCILHDNLEPADPTRNVVATNNILFSKSSSQFISEHGSINNDIAQSGTFDSNYYARPMDENGITTSTYVDQQGQNMVSFYDLDGWRFKNGFDANSKKSPVKLAAYVVNKYNGGNRFSNGSFNANANGAFCLSSPGKCSLTWNSGGKLDGGAIQVAYESVSGSNNIMGNYVSIGAVEAGKNYIIKFSVLGGNTGKTLKAFVLKNGGAYNRLSEIRYFQLTTTRTEHTFLFSATGSEEVMLAFEMNGKDCPYWMDNIQVYDADVTFTKPEDNIRFEYNTTNTNKTVALDGTYVDVANKTYTGSISLAPFSSAVLIKQQAATSSAALSTANTSGAAIEKTTGIEVTGNVTLDFKVSPNPSSDNIQIAIAGFESSKKQALSIHSVSGIVMKNIPGAEISQAVTVDISSWASGTYVINYVCDGKMINKKFVKL